MKRLIVFASLLTALSSNAQHGPGDTVPETDSTTTVQLYVPNAFTPDGNAYNDGWRVYAEGIDIYNFHLMVFDRAGQMVWESYDPSASWSGDFGGGIVPTGIYPWVIEVKEIDTDKRLQYTGFVTVLH
jgi:gliding motility-associated-like protein